MLEAELQNKNNELTLQTTALVKRNQAIQSLLEELENKRNARRTLSEQTLHPHEDSDGRDFEQPGGLGTVRKLFQQHAPKFHGPPQTAIQRSHDRRSPHLLLAPHESLHKGNSIPHERIRTGNRAAPIPSKEAFGAGRRYESRRFPNEFLKIFSQIFTSYILLHIR